MVNIGCPHAMLRLAWHLAGGWASLKTIGINHVGDGSGPAFDRGAHELRSTGRYAAAEPGDDALRIHRRQERGEAFN